MILACFIYTAWSGGDFRACGLGPLCGGEDVHPGRVGLGETDLYGVCLHSFPLASNPALLEDWLVAVCV